MPASTYEPLGSVTLTSAQAQVTFTNIPQTYTDLILVGSVIGSAGNDCHVRVNGDLSTNYSNTFIFGSGTSAVSSQVANTSIIYGNVTSMDAGEVNTMLMNFQNYSNNTINKTVLVRYNSTTTGKYVTASVAMWRSTSAINSITVTTNATGNFAVGTTLSLYGVGANQLKATGGDIITTDGTYWYHAFRTSGTFTPLSTLSCDVLVVAGGGAGGGYCGGGGAGGVAYQTSRSISTASTVTIGAGGARQATVNQSANGASGSNSVFDTITANGGGGGGSISNNGTAGGSGGGGANGTSGGAATQGSSGGATGYGFAGGNGLNAPTLGGGGGGAGAVGANAVAGTNAGNGGIGLDTWSAWLTATGLGISGLIAGGGGGGSDNGTTVGRGGFGGGTAGSSGGTVAANAMVNTGGGGGGSQNPGGVINSGAGGSGLVIVRYAV